MYAYVANDEVDMVGKLPASARRLDTQEWVMGLATATAELQEACGWYVVVEVAPPAVDVDERAELSYELVADRPTQVWTVRAETQDEHDTRVRSQNRAILRNPTANLNRITALREFLSDADVATFMDRANSTPWDNVDRRAAKTAFRTIDRIVKALEAEVRASIGGELLDELPPA